MHGPANNMPKEYDYQLEGKRQRTLAGVASRPVNTLDASGFARLQLVTFLEQDIR
jgi:hypothetical protein